MVPSRPVKILLIDDEPSIVQALTRLLHRGGYTVDTAENGQRALAQPALSIFCLNVNSMNSAGRIICRSTRTIR